MLTHPDAQTLMQDARSMQTEAARLMAAGDWRDGAEKGWLAFRAAAAALIWSITGIHHDTDTDLSGAFSALSHRRGGDYAELRMLWGHFFYYLHSEAFYDGVYTDDLPDLVREVADFIALAERLAGNDA